MQRPLGERDGHTCAVPGCLDRHGCSAAHLPGGDDVGSVSVAHGEVDTELPELFDQRFGRRAGDRPRDRGERFEQRLLNRR